MIHETIEGYTLFRSVWEALQEVEEPLIRLEIREALDKYAFTGVLDVENLSAVGKIIITLQKPVIDSNLQRIIHGRKGGRGNVKTHTQEGKKENSITPNQNFTSPSTVKPSEFPVGSSSSVGYYIEKGRILPEQEKKELTSFENILGTDVMKRAIDIVIAQQKPFSYLRGILSNKVKDGVTSLARWDEVERMKFGRYVDKSTEKNKEINYYEGMTPEEEAFWREANHDTSKGTA